MKKNQLIKALIVGTSLLMACSCSQGKQESSSHVLSREEQSSESVYVDPNRVKFPLISSIEQKVSSQIGIRVEYNSGDVSGEINFVHYNQYTKYSDSNEEGSNCFVKNEAGQGLYYSKDEDGRYSSFTCGDFNQDQYYRNSYIGRFAGQEFVFKSNQDISYLGRDCIKYTNSEEPTDSNEESLIMDKETGLVLHYGLSYLVQGRDGDQYIPSFRFDVKEIYLGDSVKTKLNQDMESVSANILDKNMLNNLGFEGELETPHFAINECSTKWQGETMSEYKIEYKERVNSGNDTYINQFETFTTCLYNMGFKSDSPAGSGTKNYEELVVDSTIDYDANVSFAAYGSKNNVTYKAESKVTVKGGQASITFTLTRI